MNKIWIIAIFALGFMTSCNGDDDSNKVNDGNFIVTSQPSSVGLTSVVLAGEFYPDRIPSAYGTQYTPLSLGIELSLTEAFYDGSVYPVYAQGIQGNHMEVTLYGLSPDTKYYYRAFIDMGTMKLYGEKLSFSTPALQLACNVDDPADISFTTASFSSCGASKSGSPIPNEKTSSPRSFFTLTLSAIFSVSDSEISLLNII